MLYKILIISIFLIKLLNCAKLGVSNEETVIEAIRENKNLLLLFGKTRETTIPKKDVSNIFIINFS